MAIFFLIVLLAVVGWFTLVMPARRRGRAHAEMQESVDVGDEVITAGGIHAFVREIADDRIKAEIAPGVVVTLDRRAVAAVAREIEVEVNVETVPKEGA